ncbi:hypothetical protein [Burkholderia metallica]
MGYINPLLRLAAARDLLALPADSRRAIASVLRALRKQANSEAETAWSRRKGPMAAYWRAVATYARDLAHALEIGRHQSNTDPSAGTTSAERSEIYVVIANTTSDGGDPVRAFSVRKSADAFAQRCRDHEDAYMHAPDVDAPQHVWDTWSEADRAWEQAHPAAPLSRRESYDVMVLPLEPHDAATRGATPPLAS